MGLVFSNLWTKRWGSYDRFDRQTRPDINQQTFRPRLLPSSITVLERIQIGHEIINHIQRSRKAFDIKHEWHSSEANFCIILALGLHNSGPLKIQCYGDQTR